MKASVIIIGFLVIFTAKQANAAPTTLSPFEEEFSPKIITTSDVQIEVDQNMAQLLQELFTSGDRILLSIKDQTSTKTAKILQLQDDLEKQIELESQDILKTANLICYNSENVPTNPVQCDADPKMFITERFQKLYNIIEKFSARAMPLL